jgi:hypothetical protein
VPADRPLIAAACCRVSCKTRPMKCPVRGRQPGHRRTPALAVGASASPVGSAVPPWTSMAEVNGTRCGTPALAGERHPEAFGHLCRAARLRFARGVDAWRHGGFCVGCCWAEARDVRHRRGRNDLNSAPRPADGPRADPHSGARTVHSPEQPCSRSARRLPLESGARALAPAPWRPRVPRALSRS